MSYYLRGLKMIHQARNGNKASRIRHPTTDDYLSKSFSQEKTSYNLPAVIGISDIANNPDNLLRLIGGSLEDIIREESQVDKRTPETLFIEHRAYKRVLTWHKLREVTPGYTLLVYNEGRKTRELDGGVIRPSRRGVTNIVEVYTEDVEHKINFPILIVKTQTEHPANISMTYRITNPELFYRNRLTIEGGGLKEMVKRVFNSGGRFISNEKSPSEITSEEYDEINQQLLEDLRPRFAEKGIGLKEAKFYICNTKAERVISNIKGIVRRFYEASAETARLQREMEVREKLDEIPVLKAQEERDKVQREAEFGAVVDETRKKLNLEVITHETREGIEDVRILKKVEREKREFELKKIMIEYTSKLFSDLIEVTKKEEDPTLRLYLLGDVRILGQSIAGNNTKYRDFLGELFEHKLKISELESQADAYAKTHPSNVEMAKAFSGLVDELKVSLNDDKLKPAIDYISNLFKSPQKEEASTETVKASSTDTQHS